MSKVEVGFITQKKLSQISRSVLDFLEKEDIDSIGSVFSRLGKFFDIKGENHKIHIESRSSEFKNECYTISYIIPKGGIPIEIIMNSDFNYFKMAISTASKLNGYVSFPTVIPDCFGNIGKQYKTIEDCSISIIKKELEKLVS